MSKRSETIQAKKNYHPPKTHAFLARPISNVFGWNAAASGITAAAADRLLPQPRTSRSTRRKEREDK